MLTFGVTLSLAKRPGSAGSVLAGVRDLIHGWHARKLGQPGADQRDFRHAEIDVSSGTSRVWEFTLAQRADDGGTWTTEIRALYTDASPEDLLLTVAMRIAAESGYLAPIRYHVESPGFLRRLPDQFDVTVGGAGVDYRPHNARTREHIDSLVQQLAAPGRPLPLIAVTEPCPIPALAESLAWFLFGLATVVHLDRDASFLLTGAVGKEMSCFDGGLRLYWPRWSRFDPPRRHPLFLGRRLAISAAQDPERPDRPIRGTLMAVLSRTAAARFEYPREMLAALAEHQKEVVRAELGAATNQELLGRIGELQSTLEYQTSLAEMAVAENAELREERDELTRDLEAARREVERLRDRLSSGAESEEDDSPWNIADAREGVERARTDFRRTLVIPRNVAIDTSEAGGFWYHVLLALYELCEKERRGEVKNKRQALLELLNTHAGVPKDTYKSADTGVSIVNPETGERIEMRERVHLKEGKPAETESVYWETIGDDRSSYRYLIGRIGRHV